jgi:hypothetical protein
MGMDRKRRAGADAASRAKAEEIKNAVLAALEANKRSARIVHQGHNLTTGQEWAAIEILGPPHGLMYTDAPPRNAELAVRLVNEMHQISDALFWAVLKDDRKAAHQIVDDLFRAGRRAAPGRPRKAPQVLRRPELIGRLALERVDALQRETGCSLREAEHGADAELGREYGIDQSTVGKYRRAAGKVQRGI